jgi:hypothetical protein
LVSRRSALGLAGGALFSAGLAGRTQGAPAQPTGEAAQKRTAMAKATAWLNDRDDGVVTTARGKGSVVQAVTEHIRTAIELDQNVKILIGRNLTKKERAYELWIFADHFFVFPLARKKGGDDGVGEFSVARLPMPREEKINYPLVAELTTLTINSGRPLVGTEKIAGSVSCLRAREVRADYAIQLTFRAESYTRSSWTYLPKDELPPEGPIQFSSDAINRSDNKWHTGPLAMFAVLCTMGGAQGKETFTFQSNPAAAMVDVLAT